MMQAPGAVGQGGAGVRGGEPILAIRHVTKTFGSTRALNSVDLEMHPGEVVGLVGHNGSGKSTLVGVLAGQYRPDSGAEASLRGRTVAFPLERAEVGLGVVTQDLGLLDNLTVLENFTIGRRIRPQGGDRVRIDWRHERQQTAKTLRSYGVPLDIDAQVGDLTLLQRALLAIVRCAEDLQHFGRTPDDPGVIVLDEATVFLPAREQQFLFGLVRENARRGTSILVVSHSIPVIRDLADRVVVLRDGNLVFGAEMDRVTDEELVALISGHRASGPAAGPGGAPAPAPGPRPGPRARPGESVFQVSGLRGGRVVGVDLEADRGEILGVAGLIGSGAEDLPYLLFGSLAATAGSVAVAGRLVPAAQLTPAASIRIGVGLVPANRRDDGLVSTMTTGENMLLLVNSRFWRQGFMRLGQARRAAAVGCHDFDILPPDPQVEIATLSGGNQQKVLLAKWCQIDPAVLLLHEPTQGVDVGARRTIHEIVRRMAAGGTAVIWFSNDFGEMAALVDRVVVVAHGQIVRELRKPEVRPGDIAAAAFGARTADQEESHG
jgi:ribose transport system ATP-binding protein